MRVCALPALLLLSGLAAASVEHSVCYNGTKVSLFVKCFRHKALLSVAETFRKVVYRADVKCSWKTVRSIVFVFRLCAKQNKKAVGLRKILRLF